MTDVVLSFPGKELSFALAKNNENLVQFCEQNSKDSLSNISFQKDNCFLRADNLSALKVINSLGVKFDFIYIDPPYNSCSKFTFNDDHRSQSNWLSMIFPRLLLAQKILSEDGIFFISIDDREIASITILMQEIFGKENHIGTIKWRKKENLLF